MSEDVHLTAYLERIGFVGSIAPVLQTLEALHALQPASIPFENLNTLTGLPIRLDPASLNRKLLAERRGGYCFELNTMFLRVVRELGFAARGHLAGVLWMGRPVEELTPDHMIISVDIDGAVYLADVGFGGQLMTAPLKLIPGIEQSTPTGDYRVTGEDPALRLELRLPGADWRPVYQFALEEVADVTFAGLSDALNDDPDWFFHHHLLVERASSPARQLLYDTRLTAGTETGPQTTQVPTAEGLRRELAATFGIGIEVVEGLDDALERLVDRAGASA